MSCFNQFRTSVSFVDSQINTVNSSFCVDNDTIHFPFPCESTSVCTPYKLKLHPGAYSITICGANGGVPKNAQKTERKSPDFPYAGGCSSGFLTVSNTATFYVTVGGHGTYGSDQKVRTAGCSLQKLPL